jgi:hypothetical protein
VPPARTLADIGRRMVDTGMPGIALMAAERRAALSRLLRGGGRRCARNSIV